MQFFTTLYVITLSATTLATLQADNNSHWKRFEVANATLEGGLEIPDGIPDGSYSVQIDDNGVAHYEQTEVFETMDSDEVLHNKRQCRDYDRPNTYQATCGGEDLNHAGADAGVRYLKARCWCGRLVMSRGAELTINNEVVTFVCNYNFDYLLWCTDKEVERQS
jgi:hypothetical protein